MGTGYLAGILIWEGWKMATSIKCNDDSIQMVVRKPNNEYDKLSAVCTIKLYSINFDHSCVHL